MITIPADVLDRHRIINREFLHLSVANNSVRLVSCDKKYMAGELIGNEPGAWEATISLANIGTDADIEINPLPMANMMFSANGNIWCMSPPEYAMWHKIVERVQSVTEQYGFMFTDTVGLGRLAAASPSGHIVWPKIIDTRQPIVLNDENDENWIGFYMGVNEAYSRNIKPAIVKGFAL